MKDGFKRIANGLDVFRFCCFKPVLKQVCKNLNPVSRNAATPQRKADIIINPSFEKCRRASVI